MCAFLLVVYSLVTISLILVTFALVAIPLMYLCLAAGYLIAFYTIGMTAGVNVAFAAGQVIVLVIASYFALRAFDKILFTVYVWQQALYATLSHPALCLSVPILELCFQLYQIWLIKSRFLIYAEMKTESYAVDEGQWLLSWLTFQQLFTVFTLRCVFEIAISGTICKHYFRRAKDDDHPVESGISRVMVSFIAAFTKSLGAAVLGGLLSYVAYFIRKLHRGQKKMYENVTWLFLPIKLSLLLVMWALSILHKLLEAFVAFTMTYVGMHGISFYEAGNKAASLMREDISVVLLNMSFSSFIMLYLGVACILTCFFTMPLILPAFASFLGDYTLLETKNWLPSFVICAYINISMLWALEGGCRAILVCVLEELKSGVPVDKLGVSDELKNFMNGNKYIKQKLT